MPRLIPRILLFLALGLATTVAVAWLLSFRSLDNLNRDAFTSPEGMRSGVEYYSCRAAGLRRCVLAGPTLTRQGLMPIPENPRRTADWAAEQLDALKRARLFPRWWSREPDRSRLADGFLWAGAIHDARGWPVLALWCEWPVAAGPNSSTLGSFGDIQPVRGGIALPDAKSAWGYPADSLRALPYRPIWIGLAADTLLFALLYVSAFHLTRSLARTIRARSRAGRNLCPKCAYPRVGLAAESPCPECGHTCVAP